MTTEPPARSELARIIGLMTLVGLAAWTAWCASGIEREMATEYDGFFTVGTIFIYVVLIAVPWTLALAIYMALRTNQRGGKP